jgi:hypothetical protein
LEVPLRTDSERRGRAALPRPRKALDIGAGFSPWVEDSSRIAFFHALSFIISCSHLA